VWHLMA